MTAAEPGAGRPRLSGLAVAAALLGVAAVVPYLLLAASVPAVVVGYAALYRVNGSGGRLRGRGLAVAGMALGGLGCVLCVFWVAVVIYGRLQADSRRARCADNLRLVGEAVLAYHDTHNGTYPRAVVAAPLPPPQRLSWLAEMLPYLDRRKDGTARWQGVHDRLDPNLPWDAGTNREALAVNVARYLCPAYRDVNPDGPPGLTSYVGLAGLGGDAAALPADDPRAGFFGYERTLTSEALQRGKGTSYLIITAETVRDNGPWCAGGRATVRGWEPAAGPVIAADGSFGGLHRDGANMLRADGAVHFERADIRPEVFRDLILVTPEPERVAVE